jgi:glycosyltransferase involved in cell wall biosynthesis
MDISVIIPVYNNAGTLKLLLDRLSKVLMEEPFTSVAKEIILVNDGSQDSSLEVIREYWKANNTGIEVSQINFSRNFGQVAAILCGAKEAKGNCVATLSADLQDPPELIAEMFVGWQKGFLINLGYRKVRADGFLNRFFSKVFYYVIKKYYPQLPMGGFDYVLLDRKVITDLISSINYKNRFLQGDIVSLGYPIKWYHYVRGLPASKVQKTFNPFKINYFIDSIFHTKFLITFLFLESLLIMLSGTLTIALHFIANYNCFIIGLVILLFGIVNMSFTAVVSYLWRVYNDMKIYPDYIVLNREDY